jgi:IS30 family transposase
VAKRGQGEHGRRLSLGDRVELERRIAAGETREQVAAAIGCDPRTVFRWVVRKGGLRSYERRRSLLRLSVVEREEIALGLARGESATGIARRLARSVSTVTREVNLNGGRHGYRGLQADSRALERARRPKPAKLVRSPRLRMEVERRLAERWSPEQIAARLVVDFPDDAEMRVSHETIYRSLYVPSRGALRREHTALPAHRPPAASTQRDSLRRLVA